MRYLCLLTIVVGSSVFAQDPVPKKDPPVVPAKTDPLLKEEVAKKARAEARRLSADPDVQAIFADILGFAGKGTYTWKASHAGEVFIKADLFEREWREAISRRPDVGAKNAKTVLAAVNEAVMKKYGTTPHVLFRYILIYDDTRGKALLSAEETLALVASLEADDQKLVGAGVRKNDPRRRTIADGLTFLRTPPSATKLPSAVKRGDEEKSDAGAKK